MASRKRVPSVPTWILKRDATVLHGVTDLVEADGVLTFTHAGRELTWPVAGVVVTACAHNAELANRPGPTKIDPRMLNEALEAASKRSYQPMTVYYEYVTAASGTVHLVRQDDPGLYLRTLCGRDPVGMTKGDETSSGGDATCRRCCSLRR